MCTFHKENGVFFFNVMSTNTTQDRQIIERHMYYMQCLEREEKKVEYKFPKGKKK